MLTPKRAKIICHACKKPIQGARTVIAEQWHCSDCAYAHDHPDRPIPEPVKRSRVKRYDGPSLFETTGYVKPKRSRADD